MSDAGGIPLFELFLAEVEEHASALNSGLLALERTPGDAAAFRGLMRAAHSIKGAARIVGLDAAVQLAHLMEDCLERLGKGEETLVRGRVDQLLQACDLLHSLCELSEAEAPRWAEGKAGLLNEVTTALSAPPPAGDAAGPAPTAPTAPVPAPEAIVPAAAVRTDVPVAGAPGRAEAVVQTGVPVVETREKPPEGGAESRTVKVNAENLDRMMRLAGESMLEPRRAAGVRAALMDAKSRLADLRASLERSAQSEDALAAVAAMAGAAAEAAALEAELRRHAEALDSLLRRSEEISASLYHEVIGSRMRPFSDCTGGFPRMVRDLARQLGKEVDFEILGGQVSVDRDILARLEAPLTHMLRNAVDHGVEQPSTRSAAGKPGTASLRLESRHHAGMLQIRVEDDGRGLDPEGIRRRIVERGMVSPQVATELSQRELFEFLFLPGFSTAAKVTEISGRGVGLDVVHRMIQECAGSVRVESVPGRGTTFILQLPLTLSVVRAAIVEVAGEPYAFPLSRLDRVVRTSAEETRSVQGRLQVDLDGRAVGVVRASSLLQLEGPGSSDGSMSLLVMSREGEPYGVVVDRFLGEQDLVVRPLDARFGKVPNVSAGAFLDDGSPVLIVDAEDMLAGVRRRLDEGAPRAIGATRAEAAPTGRRRRVLVVDDSITVREVQRQLLTRLGYEVEVAVDGMDGWNQLRAGQFDLLVSDVDMPRMNGIELVQAVRRDPRMEKLPIVIVSYKDRESDRRAGLEAGADAYLTKGAFQDETYATTVQDLIGDADA